MIKIFISHSGEDVALAEPVVKLLQQALNLSAEDIRCTSLPGYELHGGVEIDQEIRKEVLRAPVFICLVTKASLASVYVLVELGARWGAGKQPIPLLGPGVSAESLEGPLPNIVAVSCGEVSYLRALVHRIGKTLGASPGNPASYEAALKAVTTAYTAAASTGEARVVAQAVPQSAVDELAELRSDAIHDILNRPVSTDGDVAELAAFTKEWWRRVMDVLEQKFSKAEQLNFSRLGSVPNVIFPHCYNEQHAKILREFALQERRMLDIIARHTG